MDADTRHELKSNELAETLVKTKALIDKYLNTVLVVLIVVVLIYTGIRLWSWRYYSALEAGWAELAQIRVDDPTAGDAPLDQLRKIIDSAPNETLRTAARISLADGLATRAIEKSPERLDEAVTEFTTIYDSTATNPLFRAAAAFRLAGLYESKRDFAKATDFYNRLTSDPAFANSPYVKLAADRITSLDALKDAVTFVPGSAPPPPAPPAAEQPPLVIAPATSSAPASEEPKPATGEEPKPAASAPAEPAPAAADTPPAEKP